MTSPINTILLILEATGFILVDLGVEYVNNQIQIYNEMQEFKNEINKKSMLENQQNLRGEKMTKYKHLGFGFDGAAGHDILITDNLTQEIKVNKAHRHFS